jgi:hypothetical protein
VTVVPVFLQAPPANEKDLALQMVRGEPAAPEANSWQETATGKTA